MLHRQTSTKFSEKRVVVMQMIVRFGHLQQTLRADQVLAFYKTVVAPPAITGVEQGDEVLENSVGG